MTAVVLGIGMVFVIEGLVLALAPSFYDQVVEMLKDMPLQQRRLIGLASASFGVFVVWMSGI